jgi:hypothetical protein
MKTPLGREEKTGGSYVVALVTLSWPAEQSQWLKFFKEIADVLRVLFGLDFEEVFVRNQIVQRSVNAHMCMFFALVPLSCSQEKSSVRFDPSAALESSKDPDSGGKSSVQNPGKNGTKNEEEQKKNQTKRDGSDPSQLPKPPCVNSAVEQCGPFAPELVEWCLTPSISGGKACHNDKWAKSVYETSANQLRAHLTNNSREEDWQTAANCAKKRIIKGKKVSLRSLPNFEAAIPFVLEMTESMEAVPLKKWGAWRKVKVGAIEGWTLEIVLECATGG